MTATTAFPPTWHSTTRTPGWPRSTSTASDGVSAKDFAAWFDESGGSGRCSPPVPTAHASPVEQVVDWRPIIPKGEEGNAPMKLGTGPGTPARSLQLCFLQADPEAAWDRIRSYADRIDGSGLATVRLAAAFVPTIPGTNTYADQLW